MTLINKAFKLSINPLYFLFVLIIRGSISAIFKELYVNSLLKKPLKFRKPKINFLFITLPSLTLYLMLLGLRYFSGYESDSLEPHLVHFFITFMVVSRCLRALVKVLARLTSSNKKQRRRAIATKIANKEKKTYIKSKEEIIQMETT